MTGAAGAGAAGGGAGLEAPRPLPLQQQELHHQQMNTGMPTTQIMRQHRNQRPLPPPPDELLDDL